MCIIIFMSSCIIYTKLSIIIIRIILINSTKYIMSCAEIIDNETIIYLHVLKLCKYVANSYIQ